MKNVIQSLAIIAMLLLFCLADSCAQDQPKVSIIGIATGTADFNRQNLQATVGLGIWTKYGGLVLQGKQFAEDLTVNGTKLPLWSKELMLAYYGRIPVAQGFMVMPYVAAGRKYTEAGAQFMFQANDELMVGLSAGHSVRAGQMLGLSFIANFSK